MVNYKCIIVDDNEIERDSIEMFLRKINRLDIVAKCSGGVEAASLLVANSIDIVFSDIDMPELSGTALLRSVRNPPVFIFITSYSQYAIEGFDLDALDFIVKPATFERLLKAANKAISYLDTKALAENYQQQAITPTLEDENYFFIKETKGLTKLNYNEVIYIESMGDFSRIFTVSGNHITLVNLKNLEKQLPPIFQRVHKQYIINLNRIATVTSHEIILEHDVTVPVSVVNRQELLETIANKTLARHVK